MEIRAVTFDFWGTLYESPSPEGGRRPRRRAELVRSLLGPYLGSAVPSVEHLEALVHNASRLRGDCFRSLTAAKRFGWVVREIGVSLPAEALGEMAAEVSAVGRDVPPRPVASAKAVVEDLARDFELGLVSDTGLTAGEALREIMRADGLAPPLSAFSFSDETGVTKPHAGAFLPVLGELGVRPEEAVHVGDLLATDIVGACRLGMRAIWIGRESAEPLPEGCTVVGGLADVPAAIRSMV